jgi:hypothetical protein
VGAEVLYFAVEGGTMLSRHVDDARTISAAAFKDLARVERAARALRRMHRFPEPFAGRFDVFAQIDEYLALLRRNDARIPDTTSCKTRPMAPVRRSPRRRRGSRPATTTRSPRTSSMLPRRCIWSTGSTPA